MKTLVTLPILLKAGVPKGYPKASTGHRNGFSKSAEVDDLP